MNEIAMFILIFLAAVAGFILGYGVGGQMSDGKLSDARMEGRMLTARHYSVQIRELLGKNEELRGKVRAAEARLDPGLMHESRVEEGGDGRS